MIELICPKCRTILPVAESKIGTRIFVCPKCAQPLEAPATGANAVSPAPLDLGAASEEKTVAPDASHLYVQEKLREVAEKRAQKARQLTAQPEDRPSTQKKPAPPGLPTIAQPPQKKLPWAIGAGAAGATLVGGVLIYVLTRADGMPEPKPPVDRSAQDPRSREEAPAAPVTMDALVKVLQGGSAAERKQALEELRKRGLEARPALAAIVPLVGDAEMRPHAQEILSRLGPVTPADLPIYAAALRDPSPDLRVYAAGELAGLGQHAKGELVFLRVLSLDENAGVQEAARKAVVRIEEDLLASLIKGLHDKSAAARGKSAQQLAEMGPVAKGALPSLVEALADSNSAVRLAVIDVFLAIGPDAILVLGEALRDRNLQVRLTAISALGRMGADARFVLSDLIACLALDARTRDETLQALAKIGEYAIPDLVQALEREKNPARQKTLVAALERMGPEAAPGLQQALKKAKPEAGKAAAKVVAKIQSATTPPPRRDHAGTAGLIQSQLRGWFSGSDSNKDNFLDKEELARAIRGSKAKPYDYAPEGKAPKKLGPKDFNKYPDYAFLCRVDRDNDGKVGRNEFEAWAYDYADYLKRDLDQRRSIAQAQQRLLERGLSQAMRVQADAAIRQQWALYHGWRRSQDAMSNNLYQMEWMQRWMMTHLPRGR